MEHFDDNGDDLDADYEELEGEGEKNNPENAEIQPSENIENDNVNKKGPTDLVLLRKINDTVNDIKKQCTKQLLNFLTKIESATANCQCKTKSIERWMVLSKKHYQTLFVLQKCQVR